MADVINTDLGSSRPLFCPRCGDALQCVNGEWVCNGVDMILSKQLSNSLFETYVRRTHQTTPRAFSFKVGGRWHCPGCARRLLEREGFLNCDLCGLSLNEFVYSLVELHPHR